MVSQPTNQYFTAVLGWRDSDTREQQGGLGAAAGLGVMARSHATVATLPPAGLQYCATVCLTKLNTGAGCVRYTVVTRGRELWNVSVTAADYRASSG